MAYTFAHMTEGRGIETVVRHARELAVAIMPEPTAVKGWLGLFINRQDYNRSGFTYRSVEGAK